MKSWLSKAGPYRIEKIPCPHPNLNIDMSAPPTGVPHTTEGGWDSAMSVFRQHFAPHFLVGSGRLAQLVPLGKMGTSLEHPSGMPETNRIARVQIEIVGFSKETPWLPDPKTTDVLAELMALLKDEADIPLVHPFPEKMPRLPWATEAFPRRHAGKWGHVPGWYGHVEVPGNSHWDCGALRWSALLSAAKKKAEPVKPPKPKEPRWSYLVVEESGKETPGKTKTPRVTFDAQITRKPRSILYERIDK